MWDLLYKYMQSSSHHIQMYRMEKLLKWKIPIEIVQLLSDLHIYNIKHWNGYDLFRIGLSFFNKLFYGTLHFIMYIYASTECNGAIIILIILLLKKKNKLYLNITTTTKTQTLSVFVCGWKNLERRHSCCV